MNSAKQLKKDIEAFCRKHSMSGSRFSKLAVDDPAFWHKFVRGRVPSLDTYDRINCFMATYRPDRASRSIVNERNGQ